MKLFLYSLALSRDQAAVLTRLVGKDPKDISFAVIENAADIVPNSREWLGGFRDMLLSNGYQLEQIDLRNWKNKRKALREKLSAKDVIWIGGGHTYYLRWMLRKTGADSIIKDLVKDGKVYAGWSAGAIVAGPTTRYFNLMSDDPNDAPEVILEGLNLTNIVVIPHLDNKEFAQDAENVNHHLTQAGYRTLLLKDTQALIINGSSHNII